MTTKIATTEAHFGYDEIIDRSFFQVRPGISAVDALSQAMTLTANALHLLRQQRTQPDNWTAISAALSNLDAGNALVLSVWNALGDAGVDEEPLAEGGRK